MVGKKRSGPLSASGRVVTLAAMQRRGDDGFQSLEIAILFPIVILFAMLAVGAGRVFNARNEVTGAAHSGARAGTIATDAAGAANAEAQRSLSTGSKHCVNASVASSTRVVAGLTMVRTQVTCTIRVFDLGLAFSNTVTASAEEVLDRDKLPPA